MGYLGFRSMICILGGALKGRLCRVQVYDLQKLAWARLDTPGARAKPPPLSPVWCRRWQWKVTWRFRNGRCQTSLSSSHIYSCTHIMYIQTVIYLFVCICMCIYIYSPACRVRVLYIYIYIDCYIHTHYTSILLHYWYFIKLNRTIF